MTIVKIDNKQDKHKDKNRQNKIHKVNKMKTKKQNLKRKRESSDSNMNKCSLITNSMDPISLKN